MGLKADSLEIQIAVDIKLKSDQNGIESFVVASFKAQ